MVAGEIFAGSPDVPYLLLLVSVTVGLIVPCVGRVPGGLAAPLNAIFLSGQVNQQSIGRAALASVAIAATTPVIFLSFPSPGVDRRLCTPLRAYHLPAGDTFSTGI